MHLAETLQVVNHMEGMRPVNVPEVSSVQRCHLELATVFRRVPASGLVMLILEQVDLQPLVPKRQLAG
ncbi:MAG: hypothetical protein DWQ09_07325 [Proteobacteria bacterium]|nr:MAG: hypothetical protein DWQ09_07325 [Pseudomonadota bacterium]